jgi:large subunit ribosomal protein L6
MKREIKEIIELPQDIAAEIKNRVITLKKDGIEISRKYEGFEIKQEGNNLILVNEKATKSEKKLIKTIAAHLRNAVKGLQEKFVYELKVCYVHFPTTVELKGNELIIKNFLGEKVPRIAKIPQGVEVKIDKDIITVASHNKELAGQAAATIEKTSKIKYRDRRVFQDGIFITKKQKGK